MESLIHLGDWNEGNVIVNLIYDLSKISRTIQLAISNRTRVALYNLFNSVDARIKNVSVQREAMARSICVRRD